MKIKDVLNEEPNDFKNIKMEGSKTKPILYWEFKLLPATVQVHFSYNVTFNRPKIKADFIEMDGKVNMHRVEFDIFRTGFSNRSVLAKAKNFSVPGFICRNVANSGEDDFKVFNLARSNKFQYTHDIIFEAVDKKKKYDKKEIIELFTSFIKKGEKIIFADTPYYKITK